MMKYKIFKCLATSLQLIFVIGLVGLSGCGSDTTPDNDLQPAIVQSEFNPAGAALLNTITVRGTVESIESRNVYSTLSFRIDRVYAEEGDQVTEGQVLAALDTNDLQLSIAQQRASLESARQSSQNAVQETQRMLNEATANLANNTNMHILSAESSLNAAAINLESAQMNYDNALRDYDEGTNPQVLSTQSFFNTARIEFERIEANHRNLTALYAGGVVSSDEMRQSENILTHARNQYNDARINYNNAVEFQQRSLEQLRMALQSATTSHRNAQELLNASRIAARQDIERLRGSVTNAQISANLEPMEISLQLMERQLEDSIITAPVSGTITNVIAREGAFGSGLLFIIEDTDNLQIVTRFREYDISRIEEGMEVIITSDGTGNAEYTGVISRINPAATSLSPVVEFEAEIRVTSANTGLRIGMNTRIDISLE
ncbi:MAG: HlyD family secretion protein [Defluviitaleaceae bacterium]|nr:HlyD family secretion protein [Defluviitaleaceae bacterium]